ncbi:cytochrome P450 4C1-like isoform X2 [Planococcus citri]|uniref:cytochrome P450 4C1-like isoform X2 n=1 Tax=Planococcus citri TaxID=170843 RepID=UPI0031F7E0E2
MSVLIIVIFILIIFLLYIKRIRFVRGFANIPGPAAIPIFGNALQLTGSQTEFFRLMLEYSEKYRDMFLLWVGPRPFVFLYQADAIQPLLNSSVHIEKSLEYKLTEPFLGTGLVTSTGQKWHSQRKLLTPVFHYNMLENYLQTVMTESNILVEQLQKEVSNGSFDIVPYMKLAAMDIICKLTLGYQLDSQTSSNLEYVHAIEELMSIMQRRFITPWLKPNILFNCTSYAVRQQKCLDILNEFSRKIIQKKKEEYHDLQKNKSTLDINSNILQRKKGKVFLDLLIEISENESRLTDSELMEEVNTFIFAGHDTTSTTVSWCLYALGFHPEIQEKILQELDEKIPDFGKCPLKTSDMISLEYLECCVKEVLRLYPPVPLIARHVTTPLELPNQVIPPGTSVLVNVYSLHRDPENFPDPNAFNPDRFLTGELANKNPFSYIPFSAGPRNCIGQKLAMQMIKIILCNIIKNYKIRTTEKEESLKLFSEVVLVNENGIHIAIERR